jgi:hypothetical protein
MSNPPKKLNTKNTEKYAKLNITKKRLDKLIPHPKNARFHPESQIEKIVEWLAKLGYYKPIVIQVGTDYVLAGHGVLKSLLTDGYTHADVSETDNPEEWAALALMLWDNKSGELSFWDQPNLIAAEAELIEMDVKMETMGFEDGEIDSKWNVDAVGYPELPVGERKNFTQMTFILTLDQEEQVTEALSKAKKLGEFVDTGNENSNGNALARMAETYNGIS